MSFVFVISVAAFVIFTTEAANAKNSAAAKGA